jgi:hypothetical protein
MKSVGEAMAIGRTFHESVQKALCSLETGLTGFDEIDIPGAPDPAADRQGALAQTPDRLLPRRPGDAPRPLGRRDPRGHEIRSVVPRPHPRDRRRGGAADPRTAFRASPMRCAG